MTAPQNEAQGKPVSTKNKNEAIAKLNDRFRSQLSPSSTYLTLQVVQIGEKTMQKLFGLIRSATPKVENDETDSERSYGTVKIGGKAYDWSIDYYDRDGVNEPRDPANSAITTRTLTITAV